MLRAQEIEVEVAGKTVVECATFTLQPGDKVGLVGRNGAGKTSLLRALSGEAPPVAGRAVIKGELGYLPQDPRIRASVAHVTGVTHIVSGRGLDEAALRLEKLRLALEERASNTNVARFAQRRTIASRGAIRPKPRPGASPRGWECRPTASTCRSTPFREESGAG
jgi:ATPase subunit of ABC transporter with duplicated ATPase domains